MRRHRQTMLPPRAIACPQHGQRLLQHQVRFRVVGLALQTFLGRRLVRRQRRALSVSNRGYPVCQAAVLWLFASYVEADTELDLAAFEERLLQGDRRELKAKSNVSRIGLQYGRLHVAWTDKRA
jgi:hypothetical protein